MLTLAPESACDICAEGYSADSLPHSIPCGHTFCKPCLDKICEGLWSPRLPPACPLCREPFAAHHIRLIRIDLAPQASYGAHAAESAKRGYPHSAHPYPSGISKGTGLGGRGLVRDVDDGADSDDERVKSEARALEERVSRAASTKCTFDEVSALQREIEDWLQKELVRRPGSQHASLRLSAALLGAILVNGFAYDQAKKQAKGHELDLRDKLEAVEYTRKRLETEVHRQRTEVALLKSEVARLGGTAPALPAPAPPVPLGSALSALPPPTTPTRRTATSPTRAATPGPGYAAYSHFPRESPSRPGTAAPTTSPERGGGDGGATGHLAASAPRIQALVNSERARARTPVAGATHERWLPGPGASYSAGGGIARPRTAGPGPGGGQPAMPWARGVAM